MRRRLLPILLAGTAAVASGCALPGATNVAAPSVPAGVHPGGILRIGITAPAGIAPASAYEPAGELVSGVLCDTLVAANPVTGELMPAIAKHWQVSGRNVTLELRHGLHFPDGHTLTAQDVELSLAHLANPSLGSREAGLLNEVAGAQQLSQNLFADAKTPLAGVDVIDQYDVQIRLVTADPGFLYTLAQPATAPVERATSTQPANGETNPQCVGPYRLDKPYVAGADSIALDRNPSYYAGNTAFTGGGRGYPDHIVFHVYPSLADAQAAFMRGQVDLAQSASDQAPKLPTGATLVRGAAPTEEFLGIPDSVLAPLGGSVVRAALSRALNRNALAQSVWHGAALPATGYLPPGVGLSSINSACGPVAPAGGDPAGARAMLSAQQLAKLATTPVTFYVNSDGENVAEANAIAAQWKAVFGMHVAVHPMPWTTYQPQASTGAGFPGIIRLSWTAGAAAPTPTSLDPAEFLASLFATAGGEAGNWTHFEDAKVDFLYTEDVQPAQLGLKRRLLVNGLARYLCTLMPMIPVAFGESRWLVRTGVWGNASRSFLGVSGVPDLREFHQR